MIDLVEIMHDLSVHRPIFHSEFDFQHALAWQINTLVPACKIRLEYPFGENREKHLDILVFGNDWKVAIELKYRTTDIFVVSEEEFFILKGHSANDQGRYQFWRDVARVERFVSQYPSTIGYSVMLTNDSGYWNPGTKVAPIDKEFRLTEGGAVTGKLNWAKFAAPGSIKGMETTISLKGNYACNWRDYSEFQPDKYVQGRLKFRYLIVETNL